MLYLPKKPHDHLNGDKILNNYISKNLIKLKSPVEDVLIFKDMLNKIILREFKWIIPISHRYNECTIIVIPFNFECLWFIDGICHWEHIARKYKYYELLTSNQKISESIEEIIETLCKIDNEFIKQFGYKNLLNYQYYKLKNFEENKFTFARINNIIINCA